MPDQERPQQERPRRPRADAERNRARLLDAARAAFASGQAPVSLEQIAKEADVGIGTLYRHFPTREALVEALYRRELADLCASADDLLAAHAPWLALRAWMDRFAGYVTAKREMAETLRAVFASGAMTVSEAREELTLAVRTILGAGVAAGTLRADVRPEDVVAMVVGAFTATSLDGGHEQLNRMLDLLADAVRHCPPASGELPRPRIPANGTRGCRGRRGQANVRAGNGARPRRPIVSETPRAPRQPDRERAGPPQPKAAPVRAADVRGWDAEADVVIVGYGIAGAAAAIGAAADGADVLLLERTGGWGGAASLAGGFIYLGGGTALQQACGFDDTPQEMHKFLTAALGPGVDQAKLAIYAERSVEHFGWLVECGVPFRSVFFDKPAWEPYGDEGLMYSGGENAHPFADIARPAPRGHLPQMAGKRTGVRGGGYMLMLPLSQMVAKHGVTVRYDTSFQQLAVAGDGRVAGVIARTFGQQVAIRARRGVVLAGGSFAYNAGMVARHVPVLSGRPGSAIEQHDGQGIRAAQAVGADVAHMDACEVAVLADPGLMIRGIVVNGRGERVINEDTYPGRIGHALLTRHDGLGFVLADEEAVEDAAADRDPNAVIVPRPAWAGEELDELEGLMGVPAGALVATVSLYNRHALRRQDPVHHKASRWVRPLSAPFGVYDMRGRMAGFPLGGLRTDVDGAVLSVDGDPIGGLFAAGRTTAGIAAGGYASGASLGDGSFFGRRAGRAAANAAG